MVKYAIITPARDEEAFIEKTMASVVSQTIRPVYWVIVNDGSRDRTGEIIDKFAAQYPWIISTHRSNRGFREAGGGVVATFYDGYAQLPSHDWDFLVKLDADLSFSSDYFERCLEEFAGDLKLGIGGGDIYHEEKGGLALERNPSFHVRGATKIYRKECWEALEGLIRAPGWDTIDELKANMLGWSTRTFPHLRLSHFRYTGSADGAWKDCIKNGRANYITGYHPIFMLLKCAARIAKKPYVKGSIGLLWGFVSGYLRRIPQVQDQRLIRYTRVQQMRRIMMLESIWK
jgi:glycosyltransferase involved in cell wall biosynthesis